MMSLLIVKKINRKRKKRVQIEHFSVSPINDSLIKEVSGNLARQIDKKEFKKKYVPIKNILTLVGVGVFLGATVIMPNLPFVLKPFLKNENEHEIWKRFNISYLKRTLYRLERQKLVEFSEKDGLQIVKITEAGKRKILKYAIDEQTIEKPKFWDGKWRLVSYDIPGNLKSLRKIFRDRLCLWGFFPLHESVLLHAYPCEKQIEFLREYLGVGEYVRIFTISKIEDDKLFHDFFGV